MRELVVLSGKGGTGKTTILASYAQLAGKSVIVDCDVDAPNLHLVLPGKLVRREEFSASSKAYVDASLCIDCKKCIRGCRFGAISPVTKGGIIIDPLECEGCGLCARLCPKSAIVMVDHESGEWFRSDTPFGTMFHALLEPGEENSGMLVALLKGEARSHAREHSVELALVDGPPGTGCPAIASLSGADMAVMLAEPTRSGLHDLHRILDLVDKMGVRPLVVLNKYDLDESTSQQVEASLRKREVPVVGRIPFDEAVYEAMAEGIPVVSHSDSPASRAIKESWSVLAHLMSRRSE